MSAHNAVKAFGAVADIQERKREGRPAPMATCPRDDEPLMSTFEFPGAEFYCQVCRGTYGFLDPKPAETTPELQARHDELRVSYDVERKERAEATA